jgi:hypothetical protein
MTTLDQLRREYGHDWTIRERPRPGATRRRQLDADPDDGICHTTLSSADMSHTRDGGTLISLDAVRDPLTLAEAEQLADALRKLITRARSAMEAA